MAEIFHLPSVPLTAEEIWGVQRLEPNSDRRNVIVLERVRDERRAEAARGVLLHRVMDFAGRVRWHLAAGTLDQVRPALIEEANRLIDAAERQQGDRHG